MDNMNTNVNMNVDVVEKELNPKSGMAMLFVAIFGILLGCAMPIIFGAASYIFYLGALIPIGIILAIVMIVGSCIMFAGLKIVKPNEALVLTLFGKYYGTIRKDGFFFVNPFVSAFNPTAERVIDQLLEDVDVTGKKGAKGNKTIQSSSKKVSTKVNTLNNGQQKVNDIQGNPVVLGAVVIWKVVNPTKAVFNVENYYEYLSIHCDSTIRSIARLYPYDTIENDNDELTLRGSSLEIAAKMKEKLQEKVVEAGIEIMEVRLTHIAYAEEIAAAMLKRQQAAATIAAKEKIVEGAVGMVKAAIEQLEGDDILVLDDERKAAMVSNLLVVLCGEKEAQPIVNSGSIY